MKKFLPLAIIGLAMAGCSKNSQPAPAPTSPTTPTATATLLGNWQLDSAWVSGTTPPTLYQKNSLYVFPAGMASAEFTATTYTLYSGTTVDKQYNYSRVGDELYIGGMDPNNSVTIKLLTDKRLVLAGTRQQSNLTFISTTTYRR
jgi:hypothetical protein